MFGLVSSRRLSPSEKKNTKTSNYQDSGVMTADTAVSEGKRDDPFHYIMDNIAMGNFGAKRALPKGRAQLKTRPQRSYFTHKNNLNRHMEVGTGAFSKTMSLPAQAPVQKQQQSQAACSSMPYA